MMEPTTAAEALREGVRERYAAAATTVISGHGRACCDDGSCCPPGEASASSSGEAGSGSCCAPSVLEVDETSVLEVDETFGSALYTAGERDSLPVAAVAASLGCGNPTAVADLREGERVLDLGSGGGIDVLLSAKRVGPTGFAYGVDITEEMLELARGNAAKAGASNVEFWQGTIEDVPLPDASVDVVISNCVINLSVDKPKVLAEMFRVLTPGGRIGISDVVAEDHLTPAERAERGSYVGCLAGALSKTEYLDGLAAVGFIDTEVQFTHQAADGVHGAIVRATKPASTGAALDGAETVAAGGCCSVVENASCCEPEAKAGCCHTAAGVGQAAPPASCGCR